jgi:hypothetical protein
VTFAFADPAADLYGLARLGIADADGSPSGSALAMLFASGQPVTTIARGDVPVAAGADVEQLALGDLEAAVVQPERRWTVALRGEGGHGFDLTFDAAGPPAELDTQEPAARAGGMAGSEQLCHVHGSVRIGGETRELRCLGQRSHSWGDPDWGRIGATRTVAAWLDDGTGVVMSAVRPVAADGHDAEASWAAILGPAGSLQVDEPRLSTTYDEDGRQRRATLELWVGDEDAYPRRAVGEVVCGSTLDLGRLRLDCAFVRWQMEGRSGAGRYDLLRRA